MIPCLHSLVTACDCALQPYLVKSAQGPALLRAAGKFITNPIGKRLLWGAGGAGYGYAVSPNDAPPNTSNYVPAVSAATWAILGPNMVRNVAANKALKAFGGSSAMLTLPAYHATAGNLSKKTLTQLYRTATGGVNDAANAIYTAENDPAGAASQFYSRLFGPTVRSAVLTGGKQLGVGMAGALAGRLAGELLWRRKMPDKRLSKAEWTDEAYLSDIRRKRILNLTGLLTGALAAYGYGKLQQHKQAAPLGAVLKAVLTGTGVAVPVLATNTILKTHSPSAGDSGGLSGELATRFGRGVGDVLKPVIQDKGFQDTLIKNLGIAGTGATTGLAGYLGAKLLLPSTKEPKNEKAYDFDTYMTRVRRRNALAGLIGLAIGGVGAYGFTRSPGLQSAMGVSAVSLPSPIRWPWRSLGKKV